LLHFDDAPEFMESASLDDVDHKVKAAQEQLLQLRMQQEEIERQKHQLETLRVKQERFVAGKRDLLEKLGRSVSHVERELYDTQKRVEELSLTQDDFRRHLDILKSLQPEKWHRSQVDEELDQALAAIEDAEADFAKGMRRIESLRHVDSNPIAAVTSHVAVASDASGEVEGTPVFVGGTEEMIVWLRRGFAFTLPLIGALLVGLMLAKLMF
jgi:predicted RNase H-like nuclease (RuvC/YqgF family)